MVAVETVLGAVLLISGPMLVFASAHSRGRRLALRNNERRVVAFASELGHARNAKERLENLQDQMADSLDASSKAVRDTHRAVVDIPFSILESIPATSSGARQIRRLHDLASDGIYTGISMLARWQKTRRQRGDEVPPAIESDDKSPT